MAHGLLSSQEQLIIGLWIPIKSIVCTTWQEASPLFVKIRRIFVKAANIAVKCQCQVFNRDQVTWAKQLQKLMRERGGHIGMWRDWVGANNWHDISVAKHGAPCVCSLSQASRLWHPLHGWHCHEKSRAGALGFFVALQGFSWASPHANAALRWRRQLPDRSNLQNPSRSNQKKYINYPCNNPWTSFH